MLNQLVLSSEEPRVHFSGIHPPLELLLQPVVATAAAAERASAVTIGRRVAATAAPSEVRVSQTVKDLVAGSGLTFEDAGAHELKGLLSVWRLWLVLDR